jgi:hypothetical protein
LAKGKQIPWDKNDYNFRYLIKITEVKSEVLDFIKVPIYN